LMQSLPLIRRLIVFKSHCYWRRYQFERPRRVITISYPESEGCR
jgi:hypothetical protein